MIIELNKDIAQDLRDKILAHIKALNYAFTEVKTQTAHYVVGNNGVELEDADINGLEGVKKVYRNLSDYKLVSNSWKSTKTSISLEGTSISTDQLSIIAGPCAIENEQQVDKLIQHLLENNIKIMRGFVFKPRTSPYSFQGLGLDGLKMLANKTKKHGVKIVSEVMEVNQIEQMYDFVDIFQVGARNSQNFSLLNALGKVDKPILLKRGLAATIDELLYAAEYIYMNGNEKIILCERGIRTFEKAYRNTFDLNAVPILKSKTHLPVLVDPSHGIGLSEYVPDMALAGIMAGADGVLLEIHENPSQALSDGQQSLDFKVASKLYTQLQKTYDFKKSL